MKSGKMKKKKVKKISSQELKTFQLKVEILSEKYFWGEKKSDKFEIKKKSHIYELKSVDIKKLRKSSVNNKMFQEKVKSK